MVDVVSSNALQNEIEILRDALEQCLEYFDDRRDAEVVDDRWVGNEEMRMHTIVQEALGEG